MIVFIAIALTITISLSSESDSDCDGDPIIYVDQLQTTSMRMHINQSMHKSPYNSLHSITRPCYYSHIWSLRSKQPDLMLIPERQQQVLNYPTIDIHYTPSTLTNANNPMINQLFSPFLSSDPTANDSMKMFSYLDGDLSFFVFQFKNEKTDRMIKEIHDKLPFDVDSHTRR
eukprot:7414_1